MNEHDDKERSDMYKDLYHSELALRMDLEAEVKFLNNLINKQEYATPKKIADDYERHIAEQKKPYPVSHRDVQDAIDKTLKYIGEIRPDSMKVFAIDHVKQLYKIQIAMLGRIDQ